MSSIKPDIILVEGGTNDFGKNSTLEATKQGVIDLFEKCE